MLLQLYFRQADASNLHFRQVDGSNRIQKQIAVTSKFGAFRHLEGQLMLSFAAKIWVKSQTCDWKHKFATVAD
jgi:hypothetical protein